MNKGVWVPCLFMAMVSILLSCSQPAQEAKELKMFPLDSLKGIIDTQSNIQLDPLISSDGKGSVRITATDPILVPLFEIKDADIDNARLIYRAKLRTEGVKGRVYLEMWGRLPRRGEFTSRGLMSPLTGTTDWRSEEVVFPLKRGEKPDLITLNLVIDGKGTAWIDDIHLLKGPRQ